ncbi:ABC1 family-domain-containing protein [Cyathus striatus]|nr:ABC1 family-domain-containing protein [Cyathus striatus]
MSHFLRFALHRGPPLHRQAWRPNSRWYSSAGPSVAPLKPTRIRKYTRRMAYLAVAGGTAYFIDERYNASAIVRNLRTLWTCAAITFDYKWNFTPEKSEQIPELHERVANRVYNLLTSNGGLYIKIGQAIGANAALLPKPMQVKFSTLFDDAPQIPYSVVRDVFVSELGQPPDGPGGVFEIFEEKAVASASIAQVHKAKLWPRIGPDGKPEPEQWVAVKVQKPSVGKQMEWDLGAYRMVMWMFENWAFDLPVYFVVDFISDHLRQELDFEREARNAQQTADFVASEPRLRDKVYIPKVYPQYSTKRVMTAEWIDGVRLSDRPGIRRLMGERDPDVEHSTSILGASSTADILQPTFSESPPESPTSSPSSLKIPEKPLKGSTKAIMQTMVELFSAQMFDWGWVHCDPHPGNVLVRPSPVNPSKPQLVLLDHGLYVRVPNDFRRDWVRLWRGMLSGDFKEVDHVTRGWGMTMPDLLASFTLMRPVILRRGRKQKSKEEKEKEEAEKRKPMTQYEMSVKMKEKLKGFLVDTDRMPKVLIFLTRNMRMVQGNNQSFGSPVNRIKITGYWASRSQIHNRNLSFRERIHEWWHHFLFRTIMFSLDVTFWKSRFLMWLRDIRKRLHLGSGKARGSFEDELEKNMRGFAKANLGIDVGEGVFAG